MITAAQIQTILNLVSKAPTTMGQAMQDGEAVAALVQLGQGLQSTQVVIISTAQLAQFNVAPVPAAPSPPFAEVVSVPISTVNPNAASVDVEKPA